ncbi:MAG TPA: copper resistance protein CopC [Flavobacteriales bacterium]|jgi:methionine-rich copper-binding protein CopC|nr:copper resistance protein CopC [Flavobacteriales bacterium]
MNKFLGLLLLVPVLAFGHGKLIETIPAADSTVSNPEGIVLRFNQNVRLIKFLVTSENGDKLKTSFKSPHEGVWPEYNILVPNMVSGKFTVDWSVIGDDGHSLTESFAFKVE